MSDHPGAWRCIDNRIKSCPGVHHKMSLWPEVQIGQSRTNVTKLPMVRVLITAAGIKVTQISVRIAGAHCSVASRSCEGTGTPTISLLVLASKLSHEE